MESRYIGFYGPDAAALSPEDFAARHGVAFLLYANTLGPLASVVPGGATLMRSSDGSANSPAPLGKEATYTVFPLDFAEDGEAVIGSDPADANIVVNDDTISRRHAAVGRAEGGFTVRDLGSTLGTQVNGHTLDGAGVALTAGSSLTFGSVELVFLDANAFQVLANRLLR